MEPTPVAAALADMKASIARFLEAVGQDLYRSLDGELGLMIEEAHRCEAMVKSGSLGLVAEFEERGVARAVGDVTSRAWLRERLRENLGAAGTTVRMATACSAKGPHPEVGAALAAGEIGWDQSLVIVKTLDSLPNKATLEDREFAKRLLLEKAGELNADDLRKVGKGIKEAVDPDGTLPDEGEIERKRGVHYKEYGDGTAELRWRDRVEHIALGKAAIGAFDAPVAQPHGSPDPRTAPQRRADALVTVLTGYLRHGDLPKKRGRAPHLNVTANLEALKGLSGAAKAALATGGALSAAAVRLLQCDGEITPIVIDKKGKPLSVGRRYRHWTAAIWDALVARDVGCVGPSCTIPAEYCAGHHILYWDEHDGPTELDNGALLCPRHHVDVHHHGWQVRLAEDGHPEFIPPPWIDPDQRPRRNRHWRHQQDLLTPPEFPEWK